MIRRRIEELVRREPERPDDPNELARTALLLFDEIERFADVPTVTEAIHVTLERIGLRIGLYFEEWQKGH